MENKYYDESGMQLAAGDYVCFCNTAPIDMYSKLREENGCLCYWDMHWLKLTPNEKTEFLRKVSKQEYEDNKSERYSFYPEENEE